MVYSVEKTALICDETVEIGVVFIFDECDFKFGCKIGDEVVESESIFDVVVFEVDVDVFESIHTA